MADFINVKYNLTELRELAKRFPVAVREETMKVMDIIVTRLEGAVVKGTPKGVGGVAGLAGSMYGEVVDYGETIAGTVGTPLDYGLVRELGRRPGKAMPPVGPIALWAQRKLGVSADDALGVGFAIARKIAVEGFEGAHMFEKAWKANERWAQKMLYSIAGRVVRRIESGAE